MPGFWRKCRIAFRCVRFTVWGLILLLLLAFAWFNVVGLPGFLKTRLVAALHQRGVDLEFTRMRLRIIHGLVCDNVRVGAAQDAAGPVFVAREVQLRVNFPALLHFRLQVDGLLLRQGKLNLSQSSGNSLALTNLEGELRILPNDTWSLDQLRADFHGATLTFAGEMAHAPESRNWKMFATTKAPDHGKVQSSLQSLSETLQQIHFDGNPLLNVRFDGDARDVHSVTLKINARVPGVQTPWFSAHRLQFVAHIMAPAYAPVYSDPAWRFLTNLQPFKVEWVARGADLKSDRFTAAAVDCTGVWGNSRDGHSLALTVNAYTLGVTTPWFTAQNLDITAHGLAPTNAPFHYEPTWSFWTNLQPFHLELLAHGSDLNHAGLRAKTVACHGTWNSPVLAVTNLSLDLDGGPLDAGAKLDLSSSHLEFTVNSGFDLHVIAPLLPSQARQQLARISWSQPPQIHAAGTFALPAWTNDAPAWRNNFESRLSLRGNLALTNTVVAGDAPFDFVKTHFAFSDLVWHLSDFAIAQGRTAIELAAEESDATRNFHCVASGCLDAQSVRPFLTSTNAARGFGHLQFRDPVVFNLDAAGNLRSFSTLSVTGRVAATNFAIRNQWVDNATATLSYTNLVAEFSNLRLSRSNGTEHFSAEKLTLDIPGQKMLLHHGTGRILPMAVARAIGPKTAEAMEPYQFLDIPTAAVDGCIPLEQRDGDLVPDAADLYFNVIGTTPFRWRKFETPGINGTIHWLSRYLILTNVTASCYGGTAHGWADFDLLTPGDGTDFTFSMEGTNVDFNAMGRALWSPTNQLRGDLSGSVTVTRANSSDWRTWNGFGEAQLHDGLLWNAPILGLVSSFLNTVAPGLDIGNARATDASGSFVMTNGVIFTDTFEIRSRTMRLNYVGTVDLELNVSARVQAQLLRNTPVIGSFISLVLSPVSKAFECEVTGTLDRPKIDPIYVSRVLTAPLRPFRAVQRMFSSTPTNSPPSTNGPPNP